MRPFVICSIVSAFLAFAPTIRAVDSKVSDKDAKFITTAATNGEIEVFLGHLATNRGYSPDVKAFGQQMIEDHTKANVELKDLAKSKGVELNKSVVEANKTEQKENNELAKKEGAAFDKAYIEMMIKDHEETVKEFEKAANKADDPDIKAWASQTLPILQHHLEMAKDIRSKLAK